MCRRPEGLARARRFHMSARKAVVEKYIEGFRRTDHAMSAHLERMGAVVGALFASGRRRGRPSGEQPTQADRDASTRALREAIVELLEPDREALRLPAEKVAALFLGSLFSQLRSGSLGEDDSPTPAELAELADVLLHGVLERSPTETTPPPRTTAASTIPCAPAGCTSPTRRGICTRSCGSAELSPDTAVRPPSSTSAPAAPPGPPRPAPRSTPPAASPTPRTPGTPSGTPRPSAGPPRRPRPGRG